MRNDFAAFILSHGRPDNVLTYRNLRRCGYTGPIYIIVDNEDQKIQRYYENYGEQVIVFDKAFYATRVDECDNFNDRRTPLYARSACFDIAKQLGITYFIQLDDDYSNFNYRFNTDAKYAERILGNLDAVFEALVEFYSTIPALTIAIGQSGDYQGGGKSTSVSSIRTKRKAMNSFICSTERPFQFIGRLNDDVTTYVRSGNLGHLFLTILQVALKQMETQQRTGGITELYRIMGTYTKSFYTIMNAPSCCQIGVIGINHDRYHHNINWDRAVPKIISESYRVSVEE